MMHACDSNMMFGQHNVIILLVCAKKFFLCSTVHVQWFNVSHSVVHVKWFIFFCVGGLSLTFTFSRYWVVVNVVDVVDCYVMFIVVLFKFPGKVHADMGFSNKQRASACVSRFCSSCALMVCARKGLDTWYMWSVPLMMTPLWYNAYPSASLLSWLKPVL